jgi:hypothetical protein
MARFLGYATVQKIYVDWSSPLTEERMQEILSLDPNTVNIVYRRAPASDLECEILHRIFAQKPSILLTISSYFLNTQFLEYIYMVENLELYLDPEITAIDWDCLTILTSLKSVGLGLNVEADFSFFEKVNKGLQVLRLQSKIPLDVSWLKHLPNLRDLSLIDCVLKNIESFPSLPYLDRFYLSCKYGHSEDINVLNYINKNTRSLSISPDLNYGETFDVALLGNFLNLENLSIYDSALGYIESFPSLSKLESLYLDIDCQDMSFFNKINEGLQKLELYSSASKTHKSDLSYISRFKDLKELTVRDYCKNLEKVLPHLTELRELCIIAVKLPSLTCLEPLQKLEKLAVYRGSIGDFTPLVNLKHLKSLSIERASKLENLDFISEMTGLQFLWLRAISKPAKFPDITKLIGLRRVVLCAMGALTDFSAIQDSTSVEEFAVHEFKTQDIDCFLPVLANSHIKRVRLWSAGSNKYQDTVDTVVEKYGKEHVYIDAHSDRDFIYR